jgi:hypothetical protein
MISFSVGYREGGDEGRRERQKVLGAKIFWEKLN